MDVYSDDVMSAVEDGLLRWMPDGVLPRILEGARVVRMSANEHLYRSADEPTYPAVVVDGLLRLYLATGDGRELTIRYVDRGSVLGLHVVTLDTYARENTRQWNEATGTRRGCETVRESVLLMLRTEPFRTLARTDVHVLEAIYRYLTSVMDESQRHLARNLLLPMRARLAAHLLSLSERVGKELIVHGTNQQLADAVGSVRDVVSRLLRELDAEQIVVRRGRELVLLDPAALHRIAIDR